MTTHSMLEMADDWDGIVGRMVDPVWRDDALEIAAAKGFRMLRGLQKCSRLNDLLQAEARCATHVLPEDDFVESVDCVPQSAKPVAEHGVAT